MLAAQVWNGTGPVTLLHGKWVILMDTTKATLVAEQPKIGSDVIVNGRLGRIASYTGFVASINCLLETSDGETPYTAAIEAIQFITPAEARAFRIVRDRKIAASLPADVLLEALQSKMVASKSQSSSTVD